MGWIWWWSCGLNWRGRVWSERLHQGLHVKGQGRRCRGCTSCPFALNFCIMESMACCSSPLCPWGFGVNFKYVSSHAKMLSIVSGWGWVGSRQQWLLSLIVVVPFASSSTADLSSVLGLIERTFAGTVKDLSLLAFPEVNFWVNTLWPTLNLSGFLTCFPLFEFLLTCSFSLSSCCLRPCSISPPWAGRAGMRGWRRSLRKARRAGENSPVLLGIWFISSQVALASPSVVRPSAWSFVSIFL